MHCPWEGMIEMGHRAVIINPNRDESRMHRLCFDDASRVNEVWEDYEAYKSDDAASVKAVWEVSEEDKGE